MSEASQQVHELLRKARGDSDGDVSLLQEATRIADTHGDVALGMLARVKLISAANFSGNHELVLVAFTWCLAQIDRDEQLRLHWERDVFWYYKWVIDSLSEYTQVPRSQLERSFADMTQRFTRAGYGPDAIQQCRAHTSMRLGDVDQFNDAFNRWLTTPRDGISDCPACQTDALAEFELFRGNLEAAVAVAEPIIRGDQSCAEVPCVTFGRLAMPLLKLGLREVAANMCRRTIRQALSSRDLIGTLGQQSLYLELIGKPTRAIQVFETGMSWLPLVRRSWDRMRFLDGTALMFERLAAKDDTPIKLKIPPAISFHREDHAYKPSQVAQQLEMMRAQLAAEFNRRNGNDYMDQRHQQFRELVASITTIPGGE